MRIDIQADLTPELLTEAGIAYSTKDKVYGAKYLKKRNGQIGRGAFICALGVAMIVMFFVTKRAEFLVLAPVAFLIGGTSLSVYPAAGFIDEYRGDRLVLVNKSETPRDARADLIIRDPIGEVFSKLP